MKGNDYFSRELKAAEATIRQQIVEEEIEKRRSFAIEINSKMRSVLDSWFGQTTEDIFFHWRRVMVKNKRQRKIDESANSNQIKRSQQEETEKLALATKEVSTFVTELLWIKLRSH